MAKTLDERLLSLQREGLLPDSTTCDLLILDRGFDPVAPVIHEWTYEAMIHDLLEMDGPKYKPDASSEGTSQKSSTNIISTVFKRRVAGLARPCRMVN